MSLSYKFDIVESDDLGCVLWLSGRDEDWLKDFDCIPLPEDLLQQWIEGKFYIWCADYPEDGCLQLHPPHNIGDIVDNSKVEAVSLHRSVDILDNQWAFKTTLVSI